MKKFLILSTVAVAAVFTFAACSTNAVEETVAIEQTAPTTQATQANEQTSQEQDAAPSDAVTQTPVAQDDTLDRIYEHNDWAAGIIREWTVELGMTVDEIFDYVRAATTLEYGFDHGIEGGMDVSELAARVGQSSVGFMDMVHIAYNVTRSVDTARRWAAELDMNVHELGDYVFGGNDSQYLADALGVEWGEFQTVLAGVGNALWNYRVQLYVNAESVEIARNWANELGMTLDEFIDNYNGFDFDFMATIEALGIGHMHFSLVMIGAATYLNPAE